MKRKTKAAVLYAVLCFLAVEAVGYGLCAYLGLWKQWGRHDPKLGWLFFPGNELSRWYQAEPSEEARRPAPDSPELLFLGDSVLRAGAVHEKLLDQTVAGALGAFNAAVDGYSTYQERDLFIRDLARLRPKRVVLFVCLNDVMSEAENADAIRLTLKENFSLGPRTWLDREPYYRLLRWLRARAAYRNWVEAGTDEKMAGLTRPSRIELDGSRPVKPEVWTEWTRTVLQLRDAARPARFLVVLFPLRPQVRAYRDGRRDFWVNRELARFAARHGIPLLDLLPVFAASDASELKAFEDVYHISIIGHRVAVPALRAFLDAHPAARSARPS